MDLGLQGRKGIVVGAGRGIGKAIARELAREGVDLAIMSRTQDQLTATAREIEGQTGQRVIPIVVDVARKDQVDRAIAEAAERLGGLHILVNSGSHPRGKASGPIDTIVDADLLNDFDVKFMGSLRCTRAAIPHLKAQGWGRIINISGSNARNAGNLSAGARNGSLVHFTKTLAMQLGRHGITVNCIHPGPTRTERTPGMLAARAAQLNMTAEEVERSDYAEGSPIGNALGRMVDADEVAYVAAFLASEKAWAVTGTLVMADGGAGNAVYY